MYLSKSKPSNPTSNGADFDIAVAELLILITQHSVSGCPQALTPLIYHIEVLCAQPEIEFFPHQQRALLQIRKFWQRQQLLELGQRRMTH